MKMVKEGRHRLISIVSVLLVAFLVNLLLSACTSNAGGTTTSSTPVTQIGTYNSPSWWNGKTCDQGHYPEAILLTTWRGIQVCGPIPWKTTGNKDVSEDFNGHGASQLEFECPELIARYLLAAYGLDSQQADGWQIVDAYTGMQNSPFHKVENTDSTSPIYDGTIQMAPVEGDVLSYGTSDPGHTSIVTNSSVDGNGNGSIGVVEQNVSESGTATLTMTNWVIQHDAYHIGTVASWMTTRQVPSSVAVQTPVVTPSTTPSIPVPVPTPTQPPTQRTVTSQQTQSQTVNATGQGTTLGTQAKGILTARNPYSGTPRGVDMTYNAGTVFDDDAGTSPNVQMMIDATITVPGDGTHVTVPAHVVQIGTIGNISQIRGWHHYGAYTDPAPLDIDNSTPFTGGTDPQTYTVVKQSDIDTAANSLQASTRQSAVADLNSQLQSNEHLVGDPQCTYNVTSDHAAGDRATTVTVTVKAMCTATAST